MSILVADTLLLNVVVEAPAVPTLISAKGWLPPMIPVKLVAPAFTILRTPSAALDPLMVPVTAVGPPMFNVATPVTVFNTKVPAAVAPLIVKLASELALLPPVSVVVPVAE